MYMSHYLYFYKFIDGYLGNLGRSGEKNREGIWVKKEGNLSEFLSNLCQGLVIQGRGGSMYGQQAILNLVCYDESPDMCNDHIPSFIVT